MQPGACLDPIALDGSDGQIQHFGNFFFGQPAEEPVFHHRTQPRVLLLETIERGIQGQQLFRWESQFRLGVSQSDMLHSAAALVGLAPTGVVHQNLAHGPRGDSHEMSPSLPFDLRRAQELEVGLMHQLGGLERVAWPLPRQRPPGGPSELVVHQGKQLFGGVTVPVFHSLEQLGDIARRLIHDTPPFSRPRLPAGSRSPEYRGGIET